nr:hypothetical protein [Lachnospiraceae bacterium]
RRLNEQLVAAAARLMGEDNGIPLGTSVGVAMVRDGFADYNELFAQADSAMYSVKNNGKHGYEIYVAKVSESRSADDLDGELDRAIRIISERCENSGAMILGQEAFSWNYRYIERYLTRYGGVAARILFSLSCEEKGLRVAEMVTEFGHALRETLRRSDIILHWQQSQYLVVLPHLDEEDVSKVVERIMDAWNRMRFSDRMVVRYSVSVMKKDEYKKD